MTHQGYLSLSGAALLLFSGCASAEGTKPYDMSAVQHEAAASKEEAAAQTHAKQYSPGAKVEAKRCADRVCWSSEANPTQQHKDDAQRHEQLAQQHRAAAEALRNAETSACAGIDETDRVTSPFYHREDIVGVTKAQRSVQNGLEVQQVFAGGQAVFRALPGMTAEWLQRLVDCHRARAASVGFSMPEMDYCPLMLKDETATVSSVGNGFAIKVTSTDPATATEIWRRMSALK